MNGQGTGVAKQDVVAICRLFGHKSRSNGAVAPYPVFDEEVLLESRAQSLGN
jgi:hypothetical protein